ncbi:MAG: hypothetical protein IPI52_00210 [Bacteroidetes bacterium]|nr:hypothetical protein [Bacteroidota bacterium]
MIKDFATNKNIHLPTKTSKKNGQPFIEPFIKFGTSAIGIHPVTKKLFLLSASDYLLFIFNMKGDIEHIEQLNPTTFNKAEGITFMKWRYANNERRTRQKQLYYFSNTDKNKNYQ